MNQFSNFSNTSNCKQITEESRNCNVLNQFTKATSSTGYLWSGKGKTKTSLERQRGALKGHFKYIKHLQTNGNFISVSIKATQKNPEQSHWNMNGTAEFYY